MASGSVWWGVILIEGLHLLVLFSFFFYPLMLSKIERKNKATCYLQVVLYA